MRNARGGGNGGVATAVMAAAVIWWSSMVVQCQAGCYFSSELQGAFLTQDTVYNSVVRYSPVVITENAISIWGECQRRIENNVIMMIESEETPCYRCFHLRLLARNVLSVHTVDKDYIKMCYTNEQKAIESCPTPAMLGDRARHTEIMLYKTNEYDGTEIQREYCPINGRFKVSYNEENGGSVGQESRLECPTADSELDNCPSGSAMNLRFRHCSVDDYDVAFECLGHWQGAGNQKFMALKSSMQGDQITPQYRCAMYSDDDDTAAIGHRVGSAAAGARSKPVHTISLSNDSTCQSSATAVAHTETIRLFATPEPAWPHTIFCSYPEWMLGHWQHMGIDQSTIVYRDHSSFKTYTMRCVENEVDSERFLVFSRTQCGEETYSCVWATKRSANILEFQIGSRTAPNASMDICDDMYFDQSRWLTQGRLDHNLLVSPCPVNGEFTGMIPDAAGLCAKLASDCGSPDTMHYEVADCEGGEVFEERQYRCLGQWEEKGLVYTYTQRRDVGSYECFVGSIAGDEKVYIKEAGEHCQRNVDPYRYGMEIKKVGFCDPSQSSVQPIDPGLVRTTSLHKVIISGSEDTTNTGYDTVVDHHAPAVYMVPSTERSATGRPQRPTVPPSVATRPNQGAPSSSEPTAITSRQHLVVIVATALASLLFHH